MRFLICQWFLKEKLNKLKAIMSSYYTKEEKKLKNKLLKRSLDIRNKIERPLREEYYSYLKQFTLNASLANIEANNFDITIKLINNKENKRKLIISANIDGSEVVIFEHQQNVHYDLTHYLSCGYGHLNIKDETIKKLKELGFEFPDPPFANPYTDVCSAFGAGSHKWLDIFVSVGNEIPKELHEIERQLKDLADEVYGRHKRSPIYGNYYTIK